MGRCLFCNVVLTDDDKEKYTCKVCQRKIELIKKLKQVDSSKNKIEKACLRYLHKNTFYDEERKIVQEKIINYGYLFNSEPEVCFALQLEKQKIDYVPNYKIGKHKVDFFLPKLKIVLEIDGEMYHTDENKEFLRERAIMTILGNEYEIVRIPAKFVPNYILGNLKESLNFVIEKRNFDGRFRDTRYDGSYWSQHLKHEHLFGK